MKATYNTETKTVTFTGDVDGKVSFGVTPLPADIRDMAVEWSLGEGGKVIASGTFPKRGRLVSTDQATLFSERLPLVPDHNYTLVVSCCGNTATEAFTAPRPAKPFYSWEWIDGRWTAPVDYPQDEHVYDWQEKDQSWTINPDYAERRLKEIDDARELIAKADDGEETMLKGITFGRTIMAETINYSIDSLDG